MDETLLHAVAIYWTPSETLFNWSGNFEARGIEYRKYRDRRKGSSIKWVLRNMGQIQTFIDHGTRISYFNYLSVFFFVFLGYSAFSWIDLLIYRVYIYIICTSA
jgi:hypothetical protein